MHAQVLVMVRYKCREGRHANIDRSGKSRTFAPSFVIATTRSSCRAAARSPTVRRRRPAGSTSCSICRHGTAVWLILSEPCDGEIHAEIPLDPLVNRTGDHWHVRVDGLPEEFCYGYRVDGPEGQRPSLRSVDHPDRPGTRGPSRAAGPGATGAACRAAA